MRSGDKENETYTDKSFAPRSLTHLLVFHSPHIRRMPRFRSSIKDGVRNEWRIAHDDHGLDLLDAQGPRERRPLRVRKQWSTLVALSGGANSRGRTWSGERVRAGHSSSVGFAAGAVGRGAVSLVGVAECLRFSDVSRQSFLDSDRKPEPKTTLPGALAWCTCTHTVRPHILKDKIPKESLEIFVHSVKPATPRFLAERRARTAQPFRRTHGSATPLPPPLSERQTRPLSLRCRSPPPRGRIQRRSCRDPRARIVGPTAAAGNRKRPSGNESKRH